MFRVRVSVTLGKAGKTTLCYTTVYNVRLCHVTNDIQCTLQMYLEGMRTQNHNRHADYMHMHWLHAHAINRQIIFARFYVVRINTLSI
jgi:hypothetical protein